MKATQTRKQIFLGTLLGVVGMLLWGATTWASTRVGDAELQLWYRDRNTFHTDGGKHFDWVQWRNEVFGWLVYDNLVRDGLLLGKVDVPFVKSASFNARYRFRADPVYSIRDHFNKLYDRHERKSFIFPENGFRDLFLDMDFGDVGPGKLSMRVGNQQIVWGESDLFRSIDVINPLRIDQNQGAGEKFDEFRSPIWALKALYNIGDVGSWFSNVSIEPFYSPRYRIGNSDLMLEQVFRIPFHEKGCLDDNNTLIPYDRVACAKPRADGTRAFAPYRPDWIGQRRIKNPWSIFSRMGNARDGTPDYVCNTQRCSPDIFGDRTSFIPNIGRGEAKGPFNGAFGRVTQVGGVRIIGTSIWGVDWSLNYAFIPTGPNGVFDLNKIDKNPKDGQGIRPDIVYGDFGIIPDGKGGVLPPAGTFEEGLRRCLSDDGKNNKSNAKDRGPRVATFLTGGDLLGYNDPARFGPNGALLPNGNAKPGKHQAARPPLTFCAPALHEYRWSHVAGFTATYNDFDYTGMVFRLEESYSTKEVIRHLVNGLGVGRVFGTPLAQSSYQNNFDRYTPVWRSMVGFDLLRSYQFFKYIPFLHHSFSDQAWFLSGQWLMEHNFDNVANNFCQNVDNAGNGFTQAQVNADRAATGLKSYSNPQCRRYRWNHLFTLGFANQGLFASRVETRNAVVLEPRDKQWILYSQWWWRNVMGYENIELSAGVAWYPGSSIGTSWTGIQHFADRDQLWLEFTYYLL